MKKVLIVDDSATIRHQIASVLLVAGYEVMEADDGAAGCAAIEQATDLCLVLCDLNMPRMSGLDMLAQVKSIPKNATLPIVMLTTEGQSAMMRQARAAGAKGWIVKPINPDQFLTCVRKVAG